MVVMQKNQNIDRTIDFIAKFASHPTNLNVTLGNESMTESMKTRNQANAEESSLAQTTNETSDTLMGNTMSQTTLNSMQDDEIENMFLTKLIDFLIDVCIFYYLVRDYYLNCEN